MKIKDSILRVYNDFELDISAMELCSLSDEDIKLPYFGVLPQQMSLASSAYIYFNIQVTQDVNVVLVANMKNGKQIKRPLLVSNDELISLMDGFFKQANENTGMKPYYLGLWWAHYIDWKKIVTKPDRLLCAISALSINNKKLLKSRILHDLTCA